MVLYVLRERARSSSRHMPYLALITSHNVSNIPTMWEPESERFRSAPAPIQVKARAGRRNARREYEALFPSALRSFERELSEGISSSAGLSTVAQLKGVYSWPAFLRTWVQLYARDWTIPMYGQLRTMLVPQIDLANFGYQGLRMRYNDRLHAVVLTAGTQPIAKGAEVTTYYGTQCLEEYEDMYGFHPPGAKPCTRNRSLPRDAACWAGFICAEQDGIFQPVLEHAPDCERHPLCRKYLDSRSAQAPAGRPASVAQAAE
jgi:hypothetical protein